MQITTPDLDLLEFAKQINCQELHGFIDNNSGIKGIVAIYSTKLGPALGGCRFLPYKSSNLAAIDAMLLAKSMAFKSAMADLPLGGGKAVLIHPGALSIDLNQNVFDRSKALQAFGKFLNLLNGRYITAVDSGTKVADMDLIAKETKFVTSTSRFNYAISDPSVATAKGVLQGILAAVKFKWNTDDLSDIHIAIQGVGNVGYNLVKFLSKYKIKISICDINKHLLERCKHDFVNINIINDPEKIYSLDADLFSPCALGGILNDQNIEKLKATIIAGAANNQLATEKHAQYLDELGILYAPDFLINAGGIIYVAGPIINQTEEENLKKINNIYNTLYKIFQEHALQKINPYKIAYNIALKKLL